MSYTRVIPRDFFNEAKLLKCLGRLSLAILDGMLPCEVKESFSDSSDGFKICQDSSSGYIFCDNYHVTIDDTEIILCSPPNDHSDYPLMYFDPISEDDYRVFRENGEFTNHFLDFINRKSTRSSKKRVIISGQYNEYGYAVFIDKKPIYAAGNYLLESQTYLGSCEKTGKKLELPQDSCLESLERLELLCSNSVQDFVANPESYSDTLSNYPVDEFEFVEGEITYNKRLNPRKVAAKTGDLPLY